jgi:hypothetical protein
MGRQLNYITCWHLFCQHVPKKRRYPNRDAVFLSFGGATPTSDWALHAEGVANPVRGYSGRKRPEIPGVFFSSSTDEKKTKVYHFTIDAVFFLKKHLVRGAFCVGDVCF